MPESARLRRRSSRLLPPLWLCRSECVRPCVSEHDLVVMSAPLTEWTRGLVDAELLGSMPDGSVLVITGRDAIVETDVSRERPADGRAAPP